MIEVQDLRKQYGDLVAVDGVSFRAEAGAVFGLLGPNGAGKSTTINCLCGLLSPTGGQVRILGHDIVTQGRAAKAALGVVPQELAIYEEVSAAENVRYWGSAYGLSGGELKRRTDEVLEQTGLLDRAGMPVKKFSGGMKRRLNFACGIVHRPRVLLLDEPTVGVDPQTRSRLLDLVRQEAVAGTCVLYTTHYMEEAQDLCHTIGIIDHGRLIALGTLEELRGLIAQKEMVRLTGTFDVAAAGAALRAVAGVEVVQASPDSLLLALADGSRQVPALFAALESAGATVRETTLSPPSLESLFLKLTGKDLRE